MVLSPEALFQYKCDAPYAPQAEGAIMWNDPVLGIDWGIPAEDIVLSEKDMHHPVLGECAEVFDFNVDYYAE